MGSGSSAQAAAYAAAVRGAGVAWAGRPDARTGEAERPALASRLFGRLAAGGVGLPDEPEVAALPDARIARALRGEAGRVDGVALADGRELRARVTIDASATGELIAAADVPARTERESRAMAVEEGALDAAAPDPHGRHRLVGAAFTVLPDLEPVRGRVRPPFAPDAIAVGGDPAWQLGYAALVPAEVDGLLAAASNASVSWLVAERLGAPEVQVALGEAAGIAATLAARARVEPRDVPADVLRGELAAAGSPCFPYDDVPHDHPCFEAVQRIALFGELDLDEPYEFRPDERATRVDAEAIAERAVRALARPPAAMLARLEDGMTRGDFVCAVAR